MNVLALTKNDARIQFSIDEVCILKKSLLAVHEYFSVNDFKEFIHGISKDETLELAQTLQKVVNSIKDSSNFLPESQLIQLIDLSENGLTCRLTYRVLIGLRSVLCEIAHNQIALHHPQVFEIFELNEEDLNILLHALNDDAIAKIREKTLAYAIHKKLLEILKDLKFQISNSEPNSSPSQIKQKCYLKLKSHTVIFFLFTLKERTPSYTRIVVPKALDRSDIIAESTTHGIYNYSLLSLVAYLELIVTAEKISDSDLAEYSFYVHAKVTDPDPWIHVQVISKDIKSENRINLKIRFLLNSGKQPDPGKSEYWEVEESASAKDILSFTSSIKIFMSKFPKISYLVSSWPDLTG